MSKPKAVRVIPFDSIERRFPLARLWTYPAVARSKGGGYHIRIEAGRRGPATKYEYFYIDADGTIAAAPRGYAKFYRPGRIDLAELDAAVVKYAEAVA